MVPDSENPILETVFAEIHGAGRLGDIPILAGDNLKDLGLSRLRLLATLIELEDKFDIEFPANAVNCFQIVGDIAVYIQSHAMMPYDDDADERPAAASHPIERRPPARGRLHQLCARTFCRIFGVAGPAAG
jgi:acyl carrier protein